MELLCGTPIKITNSLSNEANSARVKNGDPCIFTLWLIHQLLMPRKNLVSKKLYHLHSEEMPRQNGVKQ